MGTAEADIGKLQRGHSRMADTLKSVEDKIDQNNAMTADVFEIVSNLKGFGRTVAWTGKTMLFLGKYIVLPFVGVGVLLYMLTHDGHVPPWWHDFLIFIGG